MKLAATGILEQFIETEMVIASVFVCVCVAGIVLDNRRNIEVITNKAGRGDQQVSIRDAIAISNLSFVSSRGVMMVSLRDAPHFCIQTLSAWKWWCDYIIFFFLPVWTITSLFYSVWLLWRKIMSRDGRKFLFTHGIHPN